MLYRVCWEQILPAVPAISLDIIFLIDETMRLQTFQMKMPFFLVQILPNSSVQCFIYLYKNLR